MNISGKPVEVLSVDHIGRSVNGRAPQLEGSSVIRDLRRFCGDYHGQRGCFAYDAFAWISRVCFDGRLPFPLLQWALTAWGKCLGFTVPRTGRGSRTQTSAAPPVITLHPGSGSELPNTMTNRRG
jgi:hypothetical protein